MSEPDNMPEMRVALTDDLMIALQEALAGKPLSKSSTLELACLQLQARIVRRNALNCDHAWSVCSMAPRFCLKCNANELENNNNDVSRVGREEVLQGFGAASGAHAYGIGPAGQDNTASVRGQEARSNAQGV
jgi:hypothetical protein